MEYKNHHNNNKKLKIQLIKMQQNFLKSKKMKIQIHNLLNKFKTRKYSKETIQVSLQVRICIYLTLGML